METSPNHQAEQQHVFREHSPYVMLFLYPYLNHRIQALLKSKTISSVIVESEEELFQIATLTPPALILILIDPARVTLPKMITSELFKEVPVVGFILSHENEERHKEVLPASLAGYFYQDFVPSDLLRFIAKFVTFPPGEG